MRHRLLLNWTYELPFGERRCWLNRGGGLAKVLGDLAVFRIRADPVRNAFYRATPREPEHQRRKLRLLLSARKRDRCTGGSAARIPCRWEIAPSCPASRGSSAPTRTFMFIWSLTQASPQVQRETRKADRPPPVVDQRCHPRSCWSFSEAV